MTDRTLFTVLDETAKLHGPAVAMHQPIPGRKGGVSYRTYTWTEYRDAAAEIACGLRSFGIGKGDIVALDSETRAEFYLADLGTMANGSIAAALYTSLPAADLAATLTTFQPKAIFVEDPKTMQQLRGANPDTPQSIWILLTGEGPDAITLDRLRENGRAAMATDGGLFARISGEVKPEDHAVLYLTSGATGQPKSGLVTHRALVTNLDMGPSVLPIGPEDSTLVFLPSAHIAQRVVIELLPIRCAVPVYFSEGLAKMPNELKRIRPTFLLAPPRVWERIHASISTEIRKRPAMIQKLFHGALGLGLKASRLRQAGQTVPGWMLKVLALADRLVFRTIRERLGGRLRIAISGAAPLAPELARFYEAIGLTLNEGYGLTEGGIATLNPIGSARPGSIGKPLPGVEVKLASDGELLLRSTCLFSGYFNDPEATAAVLQNGWLHTGDIAQMDSDGYISITGRKKELIVSSNGKKIYPSRIENLFKLEPIINQMVLVGDKQPYVTALFTVNASAAEGVEGMDSWKGKPLAEISAAEPVLSEVGKAVKRANQQLAPFEQIKRFRILEREFSIERGELTPTMKVRRTQVLENFRAAVSELYLGKEELT